MLKTFNREDGLESQRCEFKSLSSQRIFRWCKQCKNENKLVFHITKNGSDIEKMVYTHVFAYCWF